jgi:hypothetical protein
MPEAGGEFLYIIPPLEEADSLGIPKQPELSLDSPASRFARGDETWARQ